MEYGDVAAKERLTGRAYFCPAGAASFIDCGNVDMLRLEYGAKRKQHFRNRGGRQVLDRVDAYGVEPKFSITCDEFVTPILGLVLLGTVDSVTQPAGSTTAKTFVARHGRTFDLGVFNVSSVIMTDPAGMLPNVDFVVDKGLGKLYIPLGSGITEGHSVTVTFDQPEIVFDRVSGFAALNLIGSMIVMEEDEYAATPRTLYTFNCSLSCDSAGETKVDDFKKITLIATVTEGAMTVLSRAGFNELTGDDDVPLDFS